MELLSVNLARVLWFMNARDVNPRGLNLWGTLFPALVERYKFTEFQTKADSLRPDREPGDKFIGGEFENKLGAKLMINLTSYDDGFVADTRSSTKDSEDFLIELASWATVDFGLTFRPELVRRRAYVSELFVTSEDPLSGLHPGLQSFAEKLSASVVELEGPERLGSMVVYEPSGITLSTGGDFKPAPFVFERALEALFSENRYYSRAPVSTDLHLKLLDDLARILSS